MEAHTTPGLSVDSAPFKKNFGQIIISGMRFWATNFIPMAICTLFVLVPVTVLIAVVNRVILPSGVFAEGGKLYTFGSTSLPLLPQLLVFVLQALMTLVGSAAAYRLAIGRMLGEQTTVGRAWGLALDRAMSLLWVAILCYAACIAGLIGIIIGAFIVAVYVSLSLPVVVAENLRGRAALKRSSQLLETYGAQAFGIVVLTAGLTIAGGLVIGGIGASIGGSSVLGVVIGKAVGVMVAITIFAPLAVSVISTLYLARRAEQSAGPITTDW